MIRTIPARHIAPQGAYLGIDRHPLLASVYFRDILRANARHGLIRKLNALQVRFTTPHF